MLSSLFVFSQDFVHWTFNYVPENDNTGTLEIKAEMEEGWVIYSQFTADGGPIPTIFDLHEDEGYKLSGNVEELDTPIEKWSEMFETNVSKFKEKASFAQKIIQVQEGAVIRGSVTFMACNSVKCLPPEEIRFEVKT